MVGAGAATAASDERGRSAKWKARRDVIIDTSARVFARRGYHASIAALCEVNGLGKGAFYHYIASKEELLAAIHDRVMDEVMLGADRVAEGGGSPSAHLAMLGDELLDVIHRYPDHVWVLPPRVPGAHGQTRRAVPRAPAHVRANGRGGPAGRHRLGGVPYG
jgi:TetR/AcrR family transcriptional regulator, cholesterol catabolism regulator